MRPRVHNNGLRRQMDYASSFRRWSSLSSSPCFYLHTKAGFRTPASRRGLHMLYLEAGGRHSLLFWAEEIFNQIYDTHKGQAVARGHNTWAVTEREHWGDAGD